jgi:scyllo-inositol 2-dehydrogenase (NADP+)
MTTKVTIWGTNGRIHADRQECQVYLRDTATIPENYRQGWNVKYTTELTDPVWFYLRGEEYSAQLDHFVDRISNEDLGGINTFSSAAITDRVLELMTVDATAGPRTFSTALSVPSAPAGKARRRLFHRQS